MIVFDDFFYFFFFTDTATTEIYTLSLHDALPICFDDIVPGFEDSRPADFVNVNGTLDRKSTRLNSSHVEISYAVFCLKKKKIINQNTFTHSINCSHTLVRRTWLIAQSHNISHTVR